MSCPDCFKGAEHIHGPPPKGTESTLHGVECYVSQTGDSPNATIVFLTDAFGYKFINNRQLADVYASSTGFRVLIPHVLADPAPTSMIDNMHYLTSSDSILNPLTFLKKAYTALTVLFTLGPFLIKNRPAVAKPKILAFVRAVKAENPDAKLGVAGFCFGGRYATTLCAEPAVEGGKSPLFDASFAAHPSGNAEGDFIEAVTRFKVPYSMCIGDKDMVMSHPKVEAMEAALRKAAGPGDGEGGINYEITLKKNCTHGFAVRGIPGNKDEEKAAQEATEQAVEWFKRWLSK